MHKHWITCRFVNRIDCVSKYRDDYNIDSAKSGNMFCTHLVRNGLSSNVLG